MLCTKYKPDITFISNDEHHFNTCVIQFEIETIIMMTIISVNVVHAIFNSFRITIKAKLFKR